jgi:hypothetical protein
VLGVLAALYKRWPEEMEVVRPLVLLPLLVEVEVVPKTQTLREQPLKLADPAGEVLYQALLEQMVHQALPDKEVPGAMDIRLVVFTVVGEAVVQVL